MIGEIEFVLLKEFQTGPIDFSTLKRNSFQSSESLCFPEDSQNISDMDEKVIMRVQKKIGKTLFVQTGVNKQSSTILASLIESQLRSKTRIVSEYKSLIKEVVDFLLNFA